MRSSGVDSGPTSRCSSPGTIGEDGMITSSLRPQKYGTATLVPATKAANFDSVRGSGASSWVPREKRLRLEGLSLSRGPREILRSELRPPDAEPAGRVCG